MAGWLAGFRSSDADAASEPQPFELVCECSQRHTGVRRKTHQRIICKACGASLFVSPRDPYPRANQRRAPQPPKPAAGDRRRSSDREVRNVFKSRHRRRREGLAQAGADIDETPGPAERVTAAAAALAGAAGSMGRATVRKVSQTGASAAVSFWNFWTPLRLTGLAIVVLGVAMGSWSWHARRLEVARQVRNPAIERGLAALTAGQIDEAARELQQAVRALDTLGETDEYANSVRQTAREATALHGLVAQPLLAILDEAEEAVQKAMKTRPKPPADAKEPPPPLDSDWVPRFAALYQARESGGWIVMEAPVKRVTATEQEVRRYNAEFPIGVGPQFRRVEVRVDFEAFDHLGIKDQPQVAIFAGRLKSCRLAPDEQSWVVVLDPESGFIWTTLATYRRLGFGFSEWHRQADIEPILKRQAEALHVKPLIEDQPQSPYEPALAPG